MLRHLDKILLGTGQPDRCGNPYHGLVDGSGNLDTGVAAPGVITGLAAGPDSRVLSVPGTPAGVVNFPAAGESWRDKALIGLGGERLSVGQGVVWWQPLYIYGKTLQMPGPGWIYADAAGNRWLIRLQSPTDNPEGYSVGVVRLNGDTFAPRTFVRRFGADLADPITEMEITGAPPLSWPLVGGGPARKRPESYAGPIAAYGDWALSGAFYLPLVLDTKDGGSKALIGCAMPFAKDGETFYWVRSLVEVTVSGNGSTTGTAQGAGISFAYALVSDVDACEAHARNWEIDYLDAYGNPGHFSGANPAPYQPNWTGATYAACAYSASRLIAAWYDAAGTIVRRWLAYTRTGTQTFSLAGTDRHADRTDAETFGLLHDNTWVSTFNTASMLNTVLSDIYWSATYNNNVRNQTGSETCVFTDYYVGLPLPDPDAEHWTLAQSNPNYSVEAWTRNSHSYAHHGRWVVDFNLVTFDYLNGETAYPHPTPFYGYPTQDRTRLMISWGPVAELFLVGYLDALFGTDSLIDTKGLHLTLEGYASQLIHGWRFDRLRTGWEEIMQGRYNLALEGYALQDLATPEGVLTSQTRASSGQQSDIIAQVGTAAGGSPWAYPYPVHRLLKPHNAAYDRYTHAIAWGDTGSTVMGFV